jgi:hypothetical protein
MNLLAILLAAVVNMVIAVVWYSDALFGKTWMKLTGVKEMKPTPPKMIAGLLASVIIAYVLSSLTGFLGAPTLIRGILAGAFVWVGFVATTSINPVLWEGKPIQLYLIDNGCQLLSFLAMGAVLGMMP